MAASSVPPQLDSYAAHGNSQMTDFATQGAKPTMNSPLAQSAGVTGAFHEDFDAGQRRSSIIDGPQRSSSRSSTAVGGGVSRSNTLKKKSSFQRTGSIKRSGSRKSLRAGSIKGVSVDANSDHFHSYASTPVPTTGTPTEVLANRFQAWRQLLKSLIAYFREIQNSYDSRSKALHKVQNTISNISHPAVFMSNDGLGEATRILESYHKRSVAEANKSREIENDVIGALTGLRSDLGQKIKEIKSLSGDFKNSVEKEKSLTKQEVEKLQEALQHADHEDGGAVGKNDPYVVRLGVDRQLEKQIDEENYLHRAYLNLESSGRELESIVVGEIQKAYNAIAGILKREADDAYNAVEALRGGPIAMPKDQEWHQFVTSDPHFVNPNLPLRRVEEIQYPGKYHSAATEIRAGMLERKSKYLKSYTPGWYVLSPTHLHEFKSADKIYSQPPVMSLYLHDQKLGSHADPGSSSHKFMLKGKQSGAMHKGHNWVFRAESYDTMMAWFEDIRVLTETSGEQRQAFVRKHARSVSGTSDRGTVSSDGMEDDEADRAPYSADAASLAEQNPNMLAPKPTRPQPGGRFPSDLVIRTAGTMSSTAGGNDDDDSGDEDGPVGLTAASAVVPGDSQNHVRGPSYDYGDKDPYRMSNVESATVNEQPFVTRPYTPPHQDELAAVGALTAGAGGVGAGVVGTNAYRNHQQEQQDKENAIMGQSQPAIYQSPLPAQTYAPGGIPPPQDTTQVQQPIETQPHGPVRQPTENYSNWMAPAAAGVVGAGAGAVGADAYRQRQQDATVPEDEERDVSPLEAETAEQIALAPSPSNISTISRERSVRNSPVGNSIAEIALGNEPPVSPLATTAVAPVDDEPVIQPPEKSAAMMLGNEPPATPAPVDSAIASLQSTGSKIDSAEAPLGGNEARGAHETGQLFPTVIRHDTNLSISKLHVPGEFK